jgi:tetratricopeptide (TPR) repeat protein
MAAEASAQDDYRRIVAAWREGSGDAAALDSWSRGQIDRAVDSAVAVPSGWTWQDLRLAAMLHTRSWFLCIRTRCSRDLMPHLRAAERLLDAVVTREPGQAYFLERWYDAAAHLFHALGRDAIASDLRKGKGERLPLSPGATEARSAYARGLQFEFRATVDPELNRHRPSSVAPNVGEAVRGALSGAAAAFERALEADPSFHGASLHLGRVLMLQGLADRAAPAFAHASGSPDPRVAYLASLFAGGLAERAGQLDDAEQRYRAAWQHYPSGQAVVMALGQLFSRTGREQEARELLAAALRNGRSRSVEPFWTYLVPPVIDLPLIAAWLDELGVEARR